MNLLRGLQFCSVCLSRYRIGLQNVQGLNDFNVFIQMPVNENV
jgi:hypothetical protein